MMKQSTSKTGSTITAKIYQSFPRRYLSRMAIIILSAILVSLHAGAETKSGLNQVKVVILGDSLSAAYGIPKEASWVSLTEQHLSTSHPGVKIINTSISGETTAGGKNRLPQILQRHEPDIVIIELGGNDGLRGYPLRVIRSNLEEMITLALNQGSEVLLLGMKIPPNYGLQYTQQFFNLYQTLAAKYELAIVPFLLDGIALEQGMMQNDGIHPTADAQPRIKDLVLPELLPLLAKIRQTQQVAPG